MNEYPELIYTSEKMENIVSMVKNIAKSDTTVMIIGESGTGKDIIAKMIHYYSKRRDKNFVPINCAAINENLLESELFGHKKGSYTGAIKDRIGQFEYANNGTLFLDEIGDMPLSIQAKILRLVQDKSFVPIGSNKMVKVDVRIITATNKNLQELITEKKFRNDLYYRLAVAIINVPPLRDRKSDIIPLANYFIRCHCNNRKIKLSKESIDFFLDYTWPGNVRELKNVIEHALLFVNGSIIKKKDVKIPIQVKKNDSIKLSSGILLRTAERILILQALRNNRGKQNMAAKELGISDRVICYKINKVHNITKGEIF